MKARRFHPAAIALALLLAGCVVAWLLTRSANVLAPPPKSAPSTLITKVDEKPLETARQLAALADTQAEQDLAQQAARLAGQEVDQDFATAIRQAAERVPPQSGPVHDLAARIGRIKDRMAARQQQVAQLTKQAAASGAADRLELLNAQLALDQDELDDAQQDLARAGGDETANLERAQQQHQAVRQGPLPLGKIVAAGPPATLRDQIGEWLALGAKGDRLRAAHQSAERMAATLEREHNVLDGKMGAAPAPPPGDDSDDQDTSDAVAQLKRMSGQRKTMIGLDKRVALSRQLSGVYQSWLALVAERRRAMAHALAGSSIVILAILLAATVVKILLAGLVGRQAERRRAHQLSVVTRISVHAVALILILLVIFGAPTQAPTIIGLAGAGLTVVLKDFIVAFFGWFVLMGRNGIGLGDWVEINGVGGEVIEVGILRTVLLEMGNWNNTGHPTGRRVGFMNGFAIEGQYYNFSTAGQWLWDELQVTLPVAGDPYRMAEQMRELVERETAEDTKQAEQDWERVTHEYGARSFSARPAADLRPASSGLVVNIRYITRAPLRYEVKSRLFQGIVELMHKSDQAATA